MKIVGTFRDPQRDNESHRRATGRQGSLAMTTATERTVSQLAGLVHIEQIADPAMRAEMVGLPSLIVQTGAAGTVPWNGRFAVIGIGRLALRRPITLGAFGPSSSVAPE